MKARHEFKMKFYYFRKNFQNLSEMLQMPFKNLFQYLFRRDTEEGHGYSP